MKVTTHIDKFRRLDAALTRLRADVDYELWVWTAMNACVNLLKPDGVLMLQTPQYVEGKTIEQLRAEGATFVQHLRPQEHLHLFSRTSARELLRRAGVPHVAFEPAMFAQYDQFFVASRQPLSTNDEATIRAALQSTPGGRLAGAILDLADQRDYYHRECEARLRVIEVLDAEVKRLQGGQATARPGSPPAAS